MRTRRLEGGTETSERASRFALQMPLHFRPLAEMTWLAGQVENISRNGILFRAAAPLDVHTVIEMRFDLPAEMGGEPGAHVAATGEITRVIPAPSPQQQPLMAARIMDYRFVRVGEEGDE